MIAIMGALYSLQYIMLLALNYYIIVGRYLHVRDQLFVHTRLNNDNILRKRYQECPVVPSKYEYRFIDIKQLLVIKLLYIYIYVYIYVYIYTYIYIYIYVYIGIVQSIIGLSVVLFTWCVRRPANRRRSARSSSRPVSQRPRRNGCRTRDRRHR